MLFNSYSFLLFLAAVLMLYRLLPALRWQNLMLLVASYIFYGAWNWRFLTLIALSTVTDFVMAQKIAQTSDPTRRRFFLCVSLAFNLGLLSFFKYCNFAVESLAEVLGFFGLTAHLPTLNVILPVGISFYTFQSISYVVDVYRGKTKPADNLLDFALFVAYFPQLVAGPISRAGDLLPQLQNLRKVTSEDYREGIMLILLGYFKKVAIADTLAPMVDYVFDNPDQVSGVISLVGIWAFAIQIYGDFAGYTQIGRGVSLLLGISLASNFNAPYLARNPREFWLRWHISLSSWLRDYLYFSLGGNRKGSFRTYANLMITMLLGGLWHGAQWNFVLWGAYHGCLLAVCHALGVGKDKPARNGFLIMAQITGTFALTLIGWLLFRVKNLQQLSLIAQNIVTNFRWTEDLVLYLKPTVTTFVLLMAFHLWQERQSDSLILLRTNLWVRRAVYVFVGVTLLVTRLKPIPFIYFQF